MRYNFAGTNTLMQLLGSAQDVTIVCVQALADIHNNGYKFAEDDDLELGDLKKQLNDKIADVASLVKRIDSILSSRG